jgi:hypothetical protein
MKLLFIILFVYLGVVSCKQSDALSDPTVDNLNIASILSLQPSKQLLSQFATDFTYLRPETNENSLFKLMGIQLIDSKYMILYEKSTGQYYLYKRSGELIGKIGEIGSGPGEYRSVTDVFLWDNLREIHLFIPRQNRILRFGLDLKYKGDIKLGISPAAIEIYKNKYYICAFAETMYTRKAKNDLCLKDPLSFAEIKVLLNDKPKNPSTELKSPSDLRWFLSKNDTLYYARELDDKIEIFEIEDDTPELKYILDLKDFYSNSRDPVNSFVASLMFFDKYLKITVQSNFKNYTGYYNTETKKIESFNIVNDLDLGIEFYPMGNTQDGGYHSDDLKIMYFTSQWDSDAEKSNMLDITCKYPEKARWLKDTLSRSLEDNPLIMVIYNRN